MRPFFQKQHRAGGSPIRWHWEAARTWARLPARPLQETAELSQSQASAPCLRAGGARHATLEIARTGQGRRRREHREVAASLTPAHGRAAAVRARHFRLARPRWRRGRGVQPFHFLPGWRPETAPAGAGAAGSVCVCLGVNAAGSRSGWGSSCVQEIAQNRVRAHSFSKCLCQT